MANSNITVCNRGENLVTLTSDLYTIPDTGYSECVLSIDDSHLKAYINDNFNTALCHIDYSSASLKDALDDLKEDNKVLKSENESLKNEIKELRRNLAYLNTRVNNIIAEKQLQEKKYLIHEI